MEETGRSPQETIEGNFLSNGLRKDTVGIKFDARHAWTSPKVRKGPRTEIRIQACASQTPVCQARSPKDRCVRTSQDRVVERRECRRTRTQALGSSDVSIDAD